MLLATQFRFKVQEIYGLLQIPLYKDTWPNSFFLVLFFCTKNISSGYWDSRGRRGWDADTSSCGWSGHYLWFLFIWVRKQNRRENIITTSIFFSLPLPHFPLSTNPHPLNTLPGSILTTTVYYYSHLTDEETGLSKLVSSRITAGFKLGLFDPSANALNHY